MSHQCPDFSQNPDPLPPPNIRFHAEQVMSIFNMVRKNQSVGMGDGGRRSKSRVGDLKFGWQI